MAKTGRAKRAPAKSQRAITWSIRLPVEVVEAIRARVVELNERGEGRWSGQSLVASVLAKASREWSAQKDQSESEFHHHEGGCCFD